MDVLIRRLIRSAFQRGMADRNWAWFVIAGCVYVLRRTLSEPGNTPCPVMPRSIVSIITSMIRSR